MEPNLRRAACALLAGFCLSLPPVYGHAQPATVLTATCETLAEAVRTFRPGDAFVGIEVEGVLRAVEFDGVVAVMAICEPPSPMVVCITYSPNDYKIGDRVLLSGSYVPTEANVIQLDPCLHYPPQ